ncbi:hypothetical protein EON66_03755, partial [archaeon]
MQASGYGLHVKEHRLAVGLPAWEVIIFYFPPAATRGFTSAPLFLRLVCLHAQSPAMGMDALFLHSIASKLDAVCLIADAAAVCSNPPHPSRRSQPSHPQDVATFLQRAGALLGAAHVSPACPLLCLAIGQENEAGDAEFARLAGGVPLPPLTPTLISFLLRSALGALCTQRDPTATDVTQHCTPSLVWSVQGASVVPGAGWGV